MGPLMIPWWSRHSRSSKENFSDIEDQHRTDRVRAILLFDKLLTIPISWLMRLIRN
jgi:hypothetical protein